MPCSVSNHFCSSSTLTAATRGRNSGRIAGRPRPDQRGKSSNAATITRSLCCPNAGSSSGPSPGSPMPPSRQGLGMPEPKRSRLPALGLHPPHDFDAEVTRSRWADLRRNSHLNADFHPPRRSSHLNQTDLSNFNSLGSPASIACRAAPLRERSLGEPYRRIYQTLYRKGVGTSAWKTRA